MSDARWAIDIDRDAIATAKLVVEAAPELAEDQVEVRLDRFAMTANNVTYAALGKPVGLLANGKGYWDFFSPEGGAGRLPVWGFATVTRSAVEGVAEGEEVYGYFPMASHVRLTPGRINAGGFVDVAPHRAGMPSVYDHYLRVAALTDFAEADRDYWPVFRPLYLTGWLIADQFEDEGDYGAEQVIVASASSKTAIGFAHAMRQREGRPRLVGLTSARGRDFLAQAGVYDELVLYDEIAAIAAATPAAFVDIAGDNEVTAALHRHLGAALKLTLIVGKAHWDSAPGERFPAVGFFAPARVDKRSKEWGAAGFRDRMAAAWTHFLGDARKLFRLDLRDGADAALAAYDEAVAGRADPRTGIVIRL
ncbi:MAG: DUF2855 family protein [Sphingomonas bacterium]|nr:DUF2855 family protein [Sphingomonas bacterium]